MANKKIIIQTEVDASGAKSGLDEVSSAAKKMSTDVKQAGKEAGGGLDGIGSGGEASAAKVEKSTKSIVASIQRATALMEAGSKSSVKYYETLANQRGVSVDALRPYLDQLEKVNQSQVKVGISANQTAAAMRGVPAQFTDIITSLQGGQAPLTVFLQQGGQLKDMFGGAGNAAKALGGYVFGLINPVTIATAAVGGLAYVYAQSNNEAKEFSKALITSNNAAGLSVDVLRNLSTNIEAVGASSRSVANDSLLSLVGAGNVASSMIEKAALASVNAQTIMGKAVADTAKEFAELGKSPTSAVEKLNEKYHFLTMEIYDQIKAYEDQGRAADAAKLAQSSYADVLLSQSSKVKETLTDWERGWLRIKTATSGAFNSVMTMFDDPTQNQKIDQLLKNRDALEASFQAAQRRGVLGNGVGQAGYWEKALEQNKAEINAIRDKIKAKNDEAKAEEEKNKQVIAGIEWSKLYSQSLDKQEKKAKEIAAAENARSQALFGKNKAEIELDKEKLKLLESDAQLRKVKSSIDEKYAQKAKTQIVEQSIAWKAHEVNVAAAGKAETKVLADIEKSIAAIKFPNTLKDITAEFEKQTAAFVRINAGLDEYAIGLQGQNELAQLELSLIGQSATERGILIEQYKIELALQKEIRKIKSEIKDAGSAQILIDKATSNAEIEKSQAAIKVQQQEWSRFYDDIYNGLTDSLYRGFEAGKGFFQSFWDGIKNLFKTTVLKLAVQGVMTGVLGAGFAGTAAAATGGASQVGSAASTYSMGKSLWDGFAAAGSVGGGIAAGLGGTITGFGNLVGSQSIAAFGSGLGMSTAAAGEAAAIYGAAGNTAVAGGLTSGASIGSALAAIPGWGWAALGAAAVATKFGGGKDRVTGDQNVSGMLGTNDISRNVAWTKDGGWFNSDTAGTWKYNLANSTAIASNGKAYQDTANVGNDSALLKTLNDTYASLKAASADYAKALGLDASAIAGRADAINFALGKTKEDNDKAIAAAFGTVADSIAASLSPSLSSFAKAGESTGQTLARLATGFTDINKIIGTLGIKEFAQSLEGASSAQKLIELSGGLEKFTSGAAFFAENFLTEAEKIKPAADLVAETMARLGSSSVDTIPEFKDLVQSLDLSGEAGAKMYAELIAIAPQFKAVADYTSALNGALDQTAILAKQAADAQKLANDTAQQRASLQDEYNRLTMTSAELLTLQRDALFEANRGLFDSIQAVKAKQEAEAQAAQAAAEAIRKAQETAAAVANERNDLQNEYNRLTMSASDMLKAQRDALDESNRALFDSIEAIKLKQDAESKAAAEALRIAGERASLQDEYNRLTMSAGQLLQMQRDSLAESNKGLFDSIQAEKARQAALEESNQAVKAAAAAEEKAQNEAKSAFNSWLSDVKSAFSRESGIFNDTIKQFTSLADSLKEYGNSLTNGSAALLSPEAQYKANREQFLEVSSKARAGDKDALAKLQQVSEAFRESSLNYNASNKGYFDDLELIKKATADSILSSMAQVDVAKLQLGLLEKSVSGLIDINNSVKTLSEVLLGQFSGAGSMTREQGQMSILTGYGATVQQGLANVGGFDSLYDRTVSGDANATKTLQEQMVRWAQFGLDENAMDQLVGKDSFKKLLELFNLKSEDFRASALTTWDGKEQKLNFDRNGLFEGTTSYAKIAEDLKAMQDLARVQSSGANGIYSGNRPDPLPPPPQNTNQAETEEQIRLLKRQNELIAALVNQTASDGKDNVISLSEINKRLKAIESAGSLLGAQA